MSEKRLRSACRLVVLSLLLGLVWVGAILYSRYQQQRERELVWRIKDLAENYSRSSGLERKDSWWLKTVPPVSLELHHLLGDKKRELIEILQAYRHLSPLAGQIAERFQVLEMAMWVDGEPRLLLPKGEPTNWPPQAMVVCFVPADTAIQSELFCPSFLTEFNSLGIPTLEMPKALYAAVIFHELGHALRHNRFDGQPPALQDKEAHFKEEVEMHELGGLVLRAASQGAYDRLLERTLARVPGAGDFTRILGAITTQDYLDLDAMFGSGGTNLCSNLLGTQYALDLSFRFCESNGLGIEGKARAYRWFQENIFLLPSD